MLRRLCFLVLFLPALSGCLPSEGRVDDEKDPHFQQGRNLVNSEDYKGATEEFEQALQTNPHSAAAHFELGWLYEKAGDYAAAIYHYERHLQLQPDSPHAATVRERIRGCKQELANSEFPLPNSQNLQPEVDRLTAENSLLRQQVDALRVQLAAKPAATVSAAPQAVVSAPETAAPMPEAPAARYQMAAAPPSSQPPARPKIYVVKEHDTITQIANRCGVKPSAVLAANPRIDPRKLHVGQSLNIP
jgi:tetratricopeptide (TPR) repeat protein